MPLSSAVLVGLLGWGILVGIDLVSFPQALLSRPLITAAGAGMILGDPVSGLKVGMAMELFALDVLPMGGARYPDYGAGTIGAVVLASDRPPDEVLGFATLFALAFAMLGGWSLQVLRRANGSLVRHHAAGLAAGDPATIARIQYRGVAGDAVRSLLLTGFALATSLVLRPLLPQGQRFGLVTAVAIGCGAAAALGGALRAAGWGTRLRWLLVGLGAGLLLAVLR
jgi:mannose/fructose/N-acetylgalactosamine-specific phosphotransferase system component IIC